MVRDLLVGLDLGSYAFRMVAARPDPSGPDGIEILAVASVPARGIRRGMLIAIDDVIKAVDMLRSELERRIGQPIHDVAVGIGGPVVTSMPSRGLVIVSRPDNRIGAEDIQRVLEAAGAVSLSANSEVVDVVPRMFIVDGEGGIKNAEGMQGRRLETEAVIVTIDSSHMKNVHQVLQAGELDLIHVTPNVIATARATLGTRPKELGVAVVNIGHGTTDLVVYEEGALLAITVIPIGGSHITNDIAIGLRVSIDAAERAKHEHGTASTRDVSKREKIDLGMLDPSQEGVQFSRRQLSEIIEARLEEIFELVHAELKRVGRARLLPAGIVLSGGSANIPGVVDVARRVFHLPIQLGYPTLVYGPKEAVSSLEYTTAIGLVQVSSENGKKRRRRRFTMPRIALRERFRKITKWLLP